MRTATLGLLLLVVTACASTDTSRPDTSRKQPEPEMVWEMPPNGSPTQFNRDIYECKRENMQAGEYSTSPFGDLFQFPPHPNWGMVHECMNIRGYRWVPADPLPSKATFSDHVLEPLAHKAANDIIDDAEAKVTLAHRQRVIEIEAARLGDGGKGYANPTEAELDAKLAEENRQHEKQLAWLATRRGPVKKKLLDLFTSRVQDQGSVFAVCVSGKERRYQRTAGFPRLDDGPGHCPTTPIDFRKDFGEAGLR